MAVDRAKLDKVLALIASDNAGEALAALRMAKSMIEREGLGFAEVVKAGLAALERSAERPQERRVEDAFKAYAGAFSEMGRRTRREPGPRWAREGTPADGTMTAEYRLVADDGDGSIRFDVLGAGGDRLMAFASRETADAIRAHAADHGPGARGRFTFRKGRTASFAPA